MGYKVMRLIDADLAVEKIRVLEKEPNYQHEDEDWSAGLYMAEQAIDDVPTSDIAEQIFADLEAFHAKGNYKEFYVLTEESVNKLKKKYGVK